MPPARPMECPACGHERVARRNPPHQAWTGRPRVSPAEWICQLCSYAWHYPRPVAPPPVAGPE